MKKSVSITTILAAVLLLNLCVLADTLELKDGTVYENCYVRDEGVRLLVWTSMDKVGTSDYLDIPRSKLAPRLSESRKVIRRTKDGEVEKVENKNPLISRGDEWRNTQPLADLTITYIEMNPKLAGLHRRIKYDRTNAPTIGGVPVLDKRVKELGDKRKYLEPEYVVQDLKLKYEPGEEITLTAHVRNFGFKEAGPFFYMWFIDGERVGEGNYKKNLPEMGEAVFEHKYKWQEGKHTVTFKVTTDEAEIAKINNEVTDALWAFSYFYMVNPKRTELWRTERTAYGTFSWEDYYRWHLDIQNLLFKASVYPSAPDGILARVRLDKIHYLEPVTGKSINDARLGDDKIGYDQGGWTWNDSVKQQEGIWPTAFKAFNASAQTEWSLPHELGHQLGLVDYYALDYGGHERHTWPDNGEKICHFQNHPVAMMHWHGPQPYSEISAMYLNMTMGIPRGYFGDHYFAIPDENYLQITDINGKALPNAKVELHQRGAEVDLKGKSQIQQGVTWYPIIEDGNFNKRVSKDPVIVGTTDKFGMIRLPNRPVTEVKTLNGYHRKANPWGNINVVGGRGLMLVKVIKDDKPTAYFWLEAIDYNLAWYTGYRDKFVVTLKTPFGSIDSPVPPIEAKYEYIDKKHVRVTWEKGETRERNYIENAIGYRVYRRIGPMGLNDRPWTPVATVNSNTREFIIDLDLMKVNDIEWFSKTNRFAVSSLGALSIESDIIQAEETKTGKK